MAWCGAEAIFRFPSEAEYEIAKASLDKLSIGHFHGEYLPPDYAKVVTDLYYIDERDRELFDRVMRNAARDSS